MTAPELPICSAFQRLHEAADIPCVGLPKRQSRLQQQVLKRPGQWACVSGFLMLFWTQVLFDRWILSVPSGAILAAITWWIWRDGGWGRSWVRRHYDDNGDLRH